MIQWLYRYVFRGIGIALAIGMITILFLAINSMSNRSKNGTTQPRVSARP